MGDPDRVQDPKTLEVAASQPYIHRLTLLGAEATLRGRTLPFIDEVSRLLWDGSVTGWDQGAHLARAAGRAGLDLDDMERAIAADPAPRRALIEANQAAPQAARHWGVPLFVFGGEPFFGQDRIDVLLPPPWSGSGSLKQVRSCADAIVRSTGPEGHRARRRRP